MIDVSTKRGRLIAAALRLAAVKPWRDVTLREIAREADLGLADLRAEVSTKGEILSAFARQVDDEVLRAAPAPDDDQSPRDTIFEVVMSRFDALGEHKSALRSIFESGVIDPAFIRSLFGSQKWMLQAAGVNTDGLEGAVRVLGLTAVYAAVFRIWLEDDDPGLARTMAALDRRLRGGERALQTLDDVVGALGRFATLFKARRRPQRTASDVPDRERRPDASPDNATEPEPGVGPV